MFGIGTGELLLIFLIALFVFGPERLPSLARDIGKAMADLRKASDELTQEFMNADRPSPPSSAAQNAPAAIPATSAPALPEPTEPPPANTSRPEEPPKTEG